MKSSVVDYRTKAICLRIEAKNGTVVRITRYPRDLVMSGGHVYLAGSGFGASGYSTDTSFAAGVIDLEGMLGVVGIGRDEIASGVFDNARVYCFMTNYLAPIEDEEPIVASLFGKAQLLDNRYVVEEMALIDVLNQNVGMTHTAACPKHFGGQEFGGCHVNLATYTVTGTITSVTSGTVIGDTARGGATDWFAQGYITFTSGANLGLAPSQIKAYTPGVMTLYEAPYYPVSVGDTYSMVPGCRKRLVPDCIGKYGNGSRFGGFPKVPTSSTYAKIGGT